MKKNKTELKKDELRNVETDNTISECSFDLDPWAIKEKLEVYEDETLKSIIPIDLNEFSYIDLRYLTETENNDESNNLKKILESWYDKQSVNDAILKYRIGTLQEWKNSTIFWHIDLEGMICSGEVMEYERLNEEPVGIDGKYLVDSMSSILYKKGLIDIDFKKKNVFFGEHLLKYNEKPVVVVESEKTAVMASIEYPNYTWIATGIQNSLTYDLIKVLIGRNVILCPNTANTFLWYEKAIEFGFKVSKLTQSSLVNPNYQKEYFDLSNHIIDSYQIEDYYKNNYD